jgi:hypothetical protein
VADCQQLDHQYILVDTLIWQTEFQQRITQKIQDPTTSSAIGLLIQRVQFGSAFLGFLTGWGAKWVLEKLMGKGIPRKRSNDCARVN